MGDIENKTDVAHFVHSFYDKVHKDSLIGPIFKSKIQEGKWPKHLERMTSFWNTVLFGEIDYRGNPFSHHKDLDIKQPHFDRWISLFTKTIEDNFKGPKANETVLRAEKMRRMFEAKLEVIRSNPERFSLM